MKGLKVTLEGEKLVVLRPTASLPELIQHLTQAHHCMLRLYYDQQNQRQLRAIATLRELMQLREFATGTTRWYGDYYINTYVHDLTVVIDDLTSYYPNSDAHTSMMYGLLELLAQLVEASEKLLQPFVKNYAEAMLFNTYRLLKHQDSAKAQ
jgi:leucyl-tRNA synthetase